MKAIAEKKYESFVKKLLFTISCEESPKLMLLIAELMSLRKGILTSNDFHIFLYIYQKILKNF